MKLSRNTHRPIDYRFTPLPTEFLEEVARGCFTSTEYAVVLFAARKIFGFEVHRMMEADHISLSQFVKGTKRTRKAVQNALKSLERKKVFERLIPGAGKRSTLWKINTCYDEWLKRGVNERSPLQGEKEAENEAETDTSDAKGEQPFHPGVNERSTVEVRRGEPPFTHKRKRSKETYLKESENGSSRALINLIQEQLRKEDEAFELSQAHLDAIHTVSEKFPDQTPESLLHSFKNVLGILDDPLAAINYWTQNVGSYLPISGLERK